MLIYLLDNVHAFNNFAKNNVSVVEPTCLNSCDEELTSISSRSSIGHAHDTRFCVFELEVFILKN